MSYQKRNEEQKANPDKWATNIKQSHGEKEKKEKKQVDNWTTQIEKELRKENTCRVAWYIDRAATKEERHNETGKWSAGGTNANWMNAKQEASILPPRELDKHLESESELSRHGRTLDVRKNKHARTKGLVAAGGAWCWWDRSTALPYVGSDKNESVREYAGKSHDVDFMILFSFCKPNFSFSCILCKQVHKRERITISAEVFQHGLFSYKNF